MVASSWIGFFASFLKRGDTNQYMSLAYLLLLSYGNQGVSKYAVYFPASRWWLRICPIQNALAVRKEILLIGQCHFQSTPFFVPLS